MNLTLQYDDGGVMRDLRVAIDDLKDLSPIFRRYIKWLRPEIQKVFDQQGPGWAPLSPATLEHRLKGLAGGNEEKIRHAALSSLSLKLGREQARAGKTLASREGWYFRGTKSSERLIRATKAVARHKVLRDEFERIMAGGSTSTMAKGAKNLPKRIDRARAKADEKIAALKAGTVLGGIARSITYKIDGEALEVFSRVEWAGVHNYGGTAGHGANIPARTFLEWTPDRIEKLQEIATSYVAEKINGRS